MKLTGITKLFHKIRILGLENVLNRYYSRYAARVDDNIDVNDDDEPVNTQRLYLHIPAIHEPLTAEWVDSGYVISGDNYGFQSIPRKGDYVYVTFAYGDTKYPRWHYGWFADDEIPEDFESKDIHGFISPGQQKVLLDDANQTATIEQPNGSKIEMNEDEVTISFEGGETIKIDGNKVYISDGLTQPIALGTETKTSLDLLSAQVVALNAAITAFTSAQNTVAGSVPILAPLIPGWTALATAIAPVTSAINGPVKAQVAKIPSKNSETK